MHDPAAIADGLTMIKKLYCASGPALGLRAPCARYTCDHCCGTPHTVSNRFCELIFVQRLNIHGSLVSINIATNLCLQDLSKCIQVL